MFNIWIPPQIPAKIVQLAAFNAQVQHNVRFAHHHNMLSILKLAPAMIPAQQTVNFGTPTPQSANQCSSLSPVSIHKY